MRTFQVTTAVLKAASILSILAGETALSPLCAMETERGPWRMSFNEKGAELKLVNGARDVSLDVKAIGGFPFTYFVRVPEGFSFKGASASKGGRAEAKMREDGLLAVTVSASATQDVAVLLTF